MLHTPSFDPSNPTKFFIAEQFSDADSVNNNAWMMIAPEDEHEYAVFIGSMHDWGIDNSLSAIVNAQEGVLSILSSIVDLDPKSAKLPAIMALEMSLRGVERYCDYHMLYEPESGGVESPSEEVRQAAHSLFDNHYQVETDPHNNSLYINASLQDARVRNHLLTLVLDKPITEITPESEL